MKKQMRLGNFCKDFDVPYTTALEWIRCYELPSYKIGNRWCIDIPEYYKWREMMCMNNCQYE